MTDTPIMNVASDETFRTSVSPNTRPYASPFPLLPSDTARHLGQIRVPPRP